MKEQAIVDNQRELDTIKDIQQYIIDSLCIVKESKKMAEGDAYQEAMVPNILAWKSFWSLKLLLLPMDADFIYLAYRIILSREPDRRGFVEFQKSLSTRVSARTDVLKAIISSPEITGNFRQISGKKFLLMLHYANKMLRRIPVVNSLIRGLWILFSSIQRATRTEFLLQSIQDELIVLRLRTIDTVEYLHNQERRDFRFRNAGKKDQEFK